MPKLLLPTLTACLLAACADHSGDLVVAQDSPAPIDQPDSGIDTPIQEIAAGPGDVPDNGNPGTGGSSGSREPERISSGEGGSEGGGPPVPEPSTLLLVGSGLAAAAMLRRRRKTSPTAP